MVGSLHASQWGSHGGGSHDAVMGSSVYPVLHDPQIWAPSVVQAVLSLGKLPLVQVQPMQSSVEAAMEPGPAPVKVLDLISNCLATQAPQSFWLKAWA